VQLRVRILNSLVLSFTTVRANRDSLHEAAHVCSASLRIIDSVSVKGTSFSKVSSDEIGVRNLPPFVRCARLELCDCAAAKVN
jgi:hypothetical protein